ncbi:MAG TPA: hypothetical protein VGF93_23615 [Solirubrobacteraceae bacterium]|jgi:hypothetical protein
MTRAAIDTSALLKMVYTSLVASITIAVVFATSILGAIRATDMRRANRSVAAVAYATVAVIGVLFAASVVVYGLVLITRKG